MAVNGGERCGMSEWITIKGVAPLIGVAREWLIRNKDIGPPYHRRGTRRLYKLDEVLSWIEKQKAGGA